VGPPALAMEQRPAELGLELLDRPGQGRLRDPRPFGGAGEVERVGQRQEVPDLLHFHRGSPPINAES